MITASWLMILLGIFITAAARELRADTAAARYRQRRNEAIYAAQGAVAYLVDEIARDNHDRVTSRFDLYGRVGLPSDADFSRFDDSVSVGMNIYGEREGFGPGDEESKINLNALSAQNYSILTYLLVGQGLNEEQAVRIARAIVDWRDENSNSLNPAYHSEEEDDWKFSPKNNAYESIEEILLVQGVTPEIFEKIAPLITVFPRKGSFRINLNTASEEAVAAVAKHFCGPSNNTTESDAESLAEKIVRYRSGPDGIPATNDDQPVKIRELALNKKERVIAAAVFAVHTPVSKYISFLVRVRRSGVSMRLAAVVDRDSLDLLYWRRE